MSTVQMEDLSGSFIRILALAGLPDSMSRLKKESPELHTRLTSLGYDALDFPLLKACLRSGDVNPAASPKDR